MSSMTYEASPHPLLDLSPMEQVVLLKAARSKLRVAVVSLTEGEAIKQLQELRLIEVQDEHWFPTEGRGDLVSRVLDRLETAREVRRSPSDLRKKAAMYEQCEEEVSSLLVQIRELAV